jgi:hypothetical protein
MYFLVPAARRNKSIGMYYIHAYKLKLNYIYIYMYIYIFSVLAARRNKSIGMYMYTYIYIYIYIYTYIYIYIYIYIYTFMYLYIGELNPLPFALLVNAMLGWTIYSLLLKDYYLFIASSFPLITGPIDYFNI